MHFCAWDITRRVVNIDARCYVYGELSAQVDVAVVAVVEGALAAMCAMAFQRGDTRAATRSCHGRGDTVDSSSY